MRARAEFMREVILQWYSMEGGSSLFIVGALTVCWLEVLHGPHY